jgi:hypothetical protein
MKLSSLKFDSSSRFVASEHYASAHVKAIRLASVVTAINVLVASGFSIAGITAAACPA